MKAELRASLIYDFLQMHGDDPSEPFRDFAAVQIEIAEQKARKEADTDIRALLWLSHGHVGLYGDDGEMQCSMCMLDFKHDPIERIVATITKQARKEALIEALRAANIEMARHSTGSGFDSQPAHVASWNIVQAIRALIEREA